jgi:hypothetical protein
VKRLREHLVDRGEMNPGLVFDIGDRCREDARYYRRRGYRGVDIHAAA